MNIYLYLNCVFKCESIHCSLLLISAPRAPRTLVQALSSWFQKKRRSIFSANLVAARTTRTVIRFLAETANQCRHDGKS